MIVDGETRGVGEILQDGAQGNHRAHVTLSKDQGIIGVLENRAREGRINRVAELSRPTGSEDQTLKDIGNINPLYYNVLISYMCSRFQAI